MIDLHTHSTFSDGSFTPEELVEEAQRAGLRAIALTDHDTTHGLPRFLAAAEAREVVAVPGIEISADFEPGTMHMLGYFIRHDDPYLNEQLEWIREGRAERNELILLKLIELGCRLSMEEVRRFAGEDVVGRPHFAAALVDRGFVRDKREAFHKYLAQGKAAYVPRRRLSPEDSTTMILEAGGVPVLAHPQTLELKGAALRKLLRRLCDAGLQGIEVYYTDHDRDAQRYLGKLAAQFELVATGGSDFHGAMSRGVELGRGRGGLQVPDEVLEALTARKPEPPVD